MKSKIIYPIQPFFVMNTEEYYKHPVRDSIGAHFYRFRTKSRLKKENGAVPDGTADIIFRCDANHPQAILAGGVNSKEQNIFEADTDYFGIRLLPGALEQLCVISAGELGDHLVDFSDVSRQPAAIEKICTQHSFENQIALFLNAFPDFTERQAKTRQEEICLAILDCLYRFEGNCTMSRLENELCYSRQHLSRVFKGFTGMEIKQLSMILRFQSSLHKLNQGDGGSLASLSAAKGYYDQAHFQKEFLKFSGITPAHYQALIREYQYQKRIKLV